MLAINRIMCEYLPMNITKIAKLLEIKTTNYKADGNMHPEVAAQFAVEAVLHMIKGQPQYAEQLLDEEIEDAIKAGQAGGAIKFYA